MIDYVPKSFTLVAIYPLTKKPGLECLFAHQYHTLYLQNPTKACSSAVKLKYYSHDLDLTTALYQHWLK